ncbi:MAG: hypothetical protein KAY37_11180 [Phycisphaerae bacterium]|nr:hypothetical protein [Phycisphaerae bacterium]
MNGTCASFDIRLRWSAACAGMLFTIASLSGCNGFGGSESTPPGQGPPPSPRQHRMLKNIPIPAGFQMVRDRSNAWASGQIRWANYAFEGNASPEQIADFYTNHMPSAKFILKKESLESGEHHLSFESDTEDCNIRIRRGKLKTTLIINLGPLPKGSAERKVKPATRQP